MRLVAFLARFGIAVGLTAYLLWRSNPSAVLDALSDVAWGPIGLAVLLVLADRALMAYRWIQLLCIVEPASRPPLSSILRVFFVSSFLGTFLPASVGGDAVRAYSLRSLRVQTSDAVASVVVDRITGLASVLLMALLGLLLARDLAANLAVMVAVGASAAVCALFFVLIASRRAGAGATAVFTRLPGRLGSIGQRVVDSLQRYSR
ncbi:MAG: lysylphosphatidylglycerol synthase transmembrane domain-containing protein, partial [Vicinamibacterales bacterium]